jgi:prepilin-type N-terminal cleavage/methylation domain-containing protein
MFSSHSNEPKQAHATLGFSLIELMIVVAIILCIVVVALPTMMHVIADVRTRSSMSNLGGVMQRGRSEAIRQNKTMTVHFGTTGPQVMAFAHAASDPVTAPSKGDPVIAMGRGVQLFRTPPSGSGAPTELTGTLLWGSSTESAAPDHAHDISFNSRGMPCLYDSTSGACDPKGFVYYFTYQPPYGTNGWTAMSVSPAGRVKSWLWGGDIWRN